MNPKKLALNPQLPTVQILKNYVKVLILCISYFITTVTSSFPKIFFASSLCRNEELPRDFRLKENSFQMTTFIFDDIAAKTEERLNLVRMDTDKATEESKEALEKVRRRFFDDILFPKLIVKAIRYLIYYQRFTPL